MRERDRDEVIRAVTATTMKANAKTGTKPKGRAQRLVQGNEACAHGALYAGCRFYAGYPITPSSEILEIMAVEMPRRGGVFLQMEDELASISAVIGASWAGAKAMTATSGPGFSLMQEGIGYAAITETPCVIVDSQRWGPSTGLPTKTSQGDVMQAIWGTHGDHPVIVLTASTVREVFEMTVTAFNLSERYRVPVILLLDEVLSHMRENILWPEPGELEVVDRRQPDDLSKFRPFGSEEFLPFGEGLRFSVTGMAHDEWGFPVTDGYTDRLLRRIVGKIQDRVRELALYRAQHLEDAELVIVSYGIVSRAAESAVQQLREVGEPAGLLDLKTLWPFPDFLFEGLPRGIERVVVPELNLGQLVREVERAVRRVPHLRDVEIVPVNRVDGQLLTPEEILKATEG